jgi:hypothetical protein
MLLVICRQFGTLSTPHFLPNTPHINRFAQCKLCVLPNTALPPFWRFCRKYSIERISLSIPFTWTIRWALYSIFAAKYSARQPVFAMSSLWPVKYSAIAVLEILPEILNRTYLCFHSRYVDNPMRVTLHIRCQIQCPSAGLRCVNSVPCQIQRYCRFGDSAGNIQLAVSLLSLETCRQFDARYTPHLLQIQCTRSSLHYLNSGRGLFQC